MKPIRSVILFLTLALLASSCHSSMNFLASSAVPAATGKVQIKRDKNENYLIKITVQNLAPANRLSPPQRTYIAWIESGRNSIKKLGLLEPRSKNLDATLTATVVDSPSRIFITAENSPEIEYPNGTEVLATNRR